MRKLLLPLLVAATFSAPAVIAADFSENIKQAMASDIRTDRETKRDLISPRFWSFPHR